VASAPGFLDTTMPLDPARPITPSRPLRFNLAPARGAVRGTVISSWNQPLAGALVYLPTLSRAARTSQRGEFEIPRVPHPARLEARIFAGGYRTAQVELQSEHPPDGSLATTITLESAYGLSGEIRNAAGEPVPGVRVQLVGNSLRQHVSSSDGSGRFLLQLPRAGTFQAEAVKEPFPASRFWATVDEATPRVDIGVLRLAGEERIWGVVRSADGQGLQGVEVFDIGPGIKRDPVSRRPRIEPLARSSEDGSFEALLEVRGRRQAELEFWKSDHVPGREPVRLDASDVPLLVFLKPAWRLIGRVAAPSGDAIAGATVLVEGGREPFTLGGRGGLLRTDATGRFEVTHLSPGALLLAAYAPGFGGELRAVDESPEEGTLELEIVLSPEATLAGRVRDHDGRPVGGIGIGLAAGSSLPLGLAFGGDVSSADGRFELFGLKPGPVRLELSRWSPREVFFEELVLLAGAQELDLLWRGTPATPNE
jgi:hypothetical protein